MKETRKEKRANKKALKKLKSNKEEVNSVETNPELEEKSTQATIPTEDVSPKVDENVRTILTETVSGSLRERSPQPTKFKSKTTTLRKQQNKNTFK